MKTESEKIEISKQAAEILGREHTTKFISGCEPPNLYMHAEKVWDEILLVDDHGACAEIAADRRFDITHTDLSVTAGGWGKTQYHVATVSVEDFPSRIEATSWAILKAVIEQSKDSSNG